MTCPNCENLIALAAALKKYNRALRIALDNSRRSLEAQGPALKKAERAAREIEKGIVSKHEN